MNSRQLCLIAVALASLPAAASAAGGNTPAPANADSTYGEANRQTMMAQIIDPAPKYDTPLVTDAAHAADAVERYRGDKVKKPEKIRTSSSSVGGGSGGSGN